MSIIDCIKDNYCDAAVSHCAEKECKLRLTGLDNYVILKGEKICKDRKICDHIIFVGNDLILIIVVEFKSRNARPREIEEKLVNCSRAAVDILEKRVGVDSPPKFEFYHLVVVRNWRPHEYRRIVNTKLTIRGKRYDIIPKARDVSLFDLLSNYR